MNKWALLGYSLPLLLSACASVPGETGAEQVQTAEELVERTLADLYKQEPATREEIAQSVGYVVMDNKITKVPVVGAGLLLRLVGSDLGRLRVVAGGRRLLVAVGDDHVEGVRRWVIGSPHFFTPVGDFFCPALRIDHDPAGHLEMTVDVETLDRFLTACFG